jgi:hypothetical protein
LAGRPKPTRSRFISKASSTGKQRCSRGTTAHSGSIRSEPAGDRERTEAREVRSRPGRYRGDERTAENEKPVPKSSKLGLVPTSGSMTCGSPVGRMTSIFVGSSPKLATTFISGVTVGYKVSAVSRKSWSETRSHSRLNDPSRFPRSTTTRCRLTNKTGTTRGALNGCTRLELKPLGDGND